MTPDEKRAHWQAHLEAWQQSGLTMTDYCNQQQLKLHQLSYWKKQLQSAPQSDSAPQWLPVVVNETPATEGSASGVTLRLANGVTVELSPGFDAETLRQVLALAGPSC